MSAVTLRGHFQRRIGLQTGAVLLLLVALMQLLELLDVTGDILKRGLGLQAVATYAALRLPAETVLALPLAVLLGAATALAAMGRHLETTTVRAAGVGLGRLYRWLLPLALLLAALQVGLTESVLPPAENALKTWWRASAPADDDDAAPKRLWARTDAGPVSIDAVSADGLVLRGVRLYQRDAGGRVHARTGAAHARWDGSAWQLADVSEITIADGALLRSSVAGRAWATNLRPDDVLRLDVARPRLSSTMLADVIAGDRTATQPLRYYRSVLYRSFTAPLAPFVMLLLALPLAAGASTRDGRAGREMLMVLLLGLAYLLGDGIVGALGASGRIAPLASALAMPLAFLAIGIARIRACQI